MMLLVVGSIVAFIVAMLAIRFFIAYLQRHGFKLFGYYRIVAGSLILFLLWTGVIHS
jgi:undecaprenyl-diphosphatase